MSVERTGGRYVRDPETKKLTQVDGPALRAAAEQKAQAAAAEAAKKDKAPASPKAALPAAEKE
ncbi:hypothetical protein [Caenispirillum bisanense]|uniref:Uncharacterized protein n=1 Tax=Caenispirillum bisanense TaxID=414052 RepID=A0A286GYS5_9PROT|nr:hypothetical protein [Caenispirillum bisanense]SOE00678.1 hypothetical protein SAMN05421508_11395 [Caenispirillum bisanense]